MSVTVRANERPNVVGRLVGWWQGWRARRRAMAELACCAREDVERMAHDVGVDRADLRTLAGKWPNSADLLSRRMDKLGVEPVKAVQIEPQVVRDLQRVCSLCASKRRCRHDLARRPSDPVWREYCPNVGTLDAVTAERVNRGATRAG
jgi:hypothetical protein